MKSKLVLEQVIATTDQEASRKVASPTNPTTDGGQWDMVVSSLK